MGPGILSAGTLLAHSGPRAASQERVTRGCDQSELSQLTVGAQLLWRLKPSQLSVL